MTSRVRRLRVVEPNPAQYEPQEPSTPTENSEVSQPDSADPDIDGALAGMAVLLRVALRLMKP
jgi:hypothetical protein